MTKVSVIIPNYNHAHYLRQRIESVIHQSYQDFEMIILDDASTDNSLDIINSYKEHTKVSHLIINKENSGAPFAQWKKGIELAIGEYIWIAESDDYADSNFLKETLRVAARVPEAGLVFTDSKIVNETGDVIDETSQKKQLPKQLTNEDFSILSDKNKIFSYLLHDLVIVNASSVIFKKEALQNINLEILASFKNAGDLFVYTHVFLKQNICYLSSPYNYFRKHQSNTTKVNISSGELFKDRLKILNYFMDDLLELKDSKKQIRIFFNRHFLTALDHKYYNITSLTLSSLYKRNILKLRETILLKLYVFYRKLGIGLFNYKTRELVKTKYLKV